MSKKQIVFFTRGLGIGGAQKILAFVANKCAECGYDVSIICLVNDQGSVPINKKIKLYYLNYNGDSVNSTNILRRLYEKVKLLNNLRRKILKLNPDLVVAFKSDLVRITILSLVGKNIKVLGSERGNPYGYTKKQYKKYSKAFERCNTIVFQTQRARDAFNSNIKRKSSVIPNPCIPRISDIEPYVGIRRKVIVSAGRFDEQKRFDILINSFSKVVEKHPDYQLHIYGHGKLRNYLQNIINENNLVDKVFLKNALDDVFTEIKDSTAFVLSSDYEGIPNVLIEAMSLGMPCISTNCEPGGPYELFDGGRRGKLVPVGDIDEIANAICNLIENPEISKHYGELAREINEELSPELIGKKWIDTISPLIDSK